MGSSGLFSMKSYCNKLLISDELAFNIHLFYSHVTKNGGFFTWLTMKELLRAENLRKRELHMPLGISCVRIWTKMRTIDILYIVR
uniref:Putative ovule protein n=1 Tax=Solanum chacoense TaxID=4108 RepID=A0A0V0GVB5_SOLCH